MGPRGLNVFEKIKMPITGVLKLAPNIFFFEFTLYKVIILSNIYRLSRPVGSSIMLNVVHSTVLARGGVPSENDKRLWSAKIKTLSPCISL